MEKNPLEPRPLPPSLRANRVPVGSPLYNDMVEFMYDEAEMFDTLRLRDWVAMVAKDIEYTVPLRHTRATRDQDKSVVRTVQHMYDDYRSIMLRGPLVRRHPFPELQDAGCRGRDQGHQPGQGRRQFHRLHGPAGGDRAGL